MLNPFEFMDELYLAKTSILSLSIGEGFVIVAWVVLAQHQQVTRWTDRWTETPARLIVQQSAQQSMLMCCKNSKNKMHVNTNCKQQ